MSDIGLDWGPLDYLALALIIGAPGLAIGAALGAVLWHRHRIYVATLGAAAGLILWLAGFALWEASPWS